MACRQHRVRRYQGTRACQWARIAHDLYDKGVVCWFTCCPSIIPKTKFAETEIEAIVLISTTCEGA
jgi:hypothetical protein